MEAITNSTERLNILVANEQVETIHNQALRIDLGSDLMSIVEQLEEEECDCECCNGGCGAGNLVKCGETLDVVMARFTSLIEEEDYKTAFDLATELDDMDIENGTYALSIFYHNGQHVAQNYTREVSLLQKAASQGYEPAIFNLAMAMSLGKGIEQDAEMGFEMICDLAEDGYEPAIEMMVD